MPPEQSKKETPVPGTAAEDGRRKLGAYGEEDRPSGPFLPSSFLPGIALALSVERLDAYDADNKDPRVALARYLLNMALCETLYSPLQFCEVALRNAIHRHLTRLMGREDWFEDDHFSLTPWAAEEIKKAKKKILRMNRNLTPGRIVAELQLGFWTSLFEAHYEEKTPFLPEGIKGVFPHLPKSQHRRKELKRILEEIRVLRNRVFHHERIVHWKDLDDQHAAILRVIGWISRELHAMALTLDRYTLVRGQGLGPWLAKL